jgi:hypothetical protein
MKVGGRARSANEFGIHCVFLHNLSVVQVRIPLKGRIGGTVPLRVQFQYFSLVVGASGDDFHKKQSFLWKSEEGGFEPPIQV